MISINNQPEQPVPIDSGNEFRAELDRIYRQAQDNPLQGLHDIINLMQALNIELIKAYAPPLIVAAHAKATLTRHEMKAVTCLGKLQEAITKLGAANVKVKEAIKRRTLKAGITCK